jgi:formylmethanofuran dehydrogenase subunit A
LLIEDPWKIFMTTDHPNGGPFTSYPRIIAWLMSRKAREATMRKANRRARSKSLLTSIDRELGFQEVAIVTRAGQAKALGLSNKGHLGLGADADIAVYNVNPEKIDASQDYKKVRRAFRHAAYTIKNGIITVKDDEIVKSVEGSTIWLDVQTSEPVRVTEDMKRRFRDYWTVEYENYPVPENNLRVSRRIAVEADV